MLLLSQNLLKIHLKVARLLSLPRTLASDLLVEVVDLLCHHLSSGPILQLAHLFAGELGRLRIFIR